MAPLWNGRLFFGDSDKEGLSRNSNIDPEFISVHSKQRFNDMVCMSKADFKSLLDTYVGGCKEWKTQPGTILVEPKVLVALAKGERKVQDLQPGEFVIVAPEGPK